MDTDRIIADLQDILEDYTTQNVFAKMDSIEGAIAFMSKYRVPDVDEVDLDPDSFVRIGDVLECLHELAIANDVVFHAIGLIEWAMGKRAVSKTELWDSWERQFEDEYVTCE